MTMHRRTARDGHRFVSHAHHSRRCDLDREPAAAVRALVPLVRTCASPPGLAMLIAIASSCAAGPPHCELAPRTPTAAPMLWRGGGAGGPRGWGFGGGPAAGGRPRPPPPRAAGARAPAGPPPPPGGGPPPDRARPAPPPPPG